MFIFIIISIIMSCFDFGYIWKLIMVKKVQINFKSFWFHLSRSNLSVCSEEGLV